MKGSCIMTLDIHSARKNPAGRSLGSGARSARSARDGASVRDTVPAHETVSAISTHTPLIHAGVVETEAHDELVLDRVSPSLLRITRGDRVMGFVEHVGRVYVALAGERYDRAVEVAQSLDVTRAARALA
jgi:hypothetical protein